MLLRTYSEEAEIASRNRSRAYKELVRLEEVSGVTLKRAEVQHYELEERQALGKILKLINGNVPPLPKD